MEAIGELHTSATLPREKSLITYWIEDWIGLSASLDIL